MEGTSDLDRITERLESLARELDDGPEEQRAAELVREASELAAEAGQAVERAIRGQDSGPAPDAPAPGPS